MIGADMIGADMIGADVEVHQTPLEARRAGVALELTAARPVIGPVLARRLDRLARRAHAFHRFAHHPLCANYAGELIALSGRRRVCRGCCYALAAALAGSISGVILPQSAAARAGTALAAVTVIALGLATERWSRGRTLQLGRRASKLWTRAAPAFAIALGLASQLCSPGALELGCAGLLLAGCAALWLSYQRRGPDRTPCTVCPERDRAPCSGFRAIVRAERAFARRAARQIDLDARAESP